jgi:hypothetical protein
MVEPVPGLLLGEDTWVEHHEVLVAEEPDEPVPVGLPGQAHQEARGRYDIQIRTSHASSRRPCRISARPGYRCRPGRETAACDIPVSAAIDRVDQCVSWPRPFWVSVLVTTTSACSSVILRGSPGRGASASPSSRLSRKRDRHLRIISRDTPNREATAVTGAVPAFSAQASTIFAGSAERLPSLGRRRFRG